MTTTDVILWGGTGQAKLVRPILERSGHRVVAVFDDTPDLTPPFPDVPLYHGSTYPAWRADQHDGGTTGFVICIGNPHGGRRLALHDQLAADGLEAVSAIHETAFVEPGAMIGPGAQILAFAYVGAEATLGRSVILNAHSSVDHECQLGDGAELAPGAVLCGLVRVGDRAWIGAGATVLPRCRIGADAIVGGGALVRQDVGLSETVVGVPARVMVRKAGLGSTAPEGAGP